MKTLNWNKVPRQQLENSLWGQSQESKLDVSVNYDLIDELFALRRQTPAVPKPNEKPKRESSLITLLDSRRSLTINIYLRQFSCPVEDIAKAIQDGNSTFFGADRLRSLSKILPDKDELDLVKSYSDSESKLAPAEKFFLALSRTPAFSIRIEGLLVKEVFPPTARDIHEQLDLLSNAGKRLMTDESLRSFLLLTLHTGNYLNAGSYAGNAAGFKLSSLPQLYETRANKPRMTLLHVLVDIANEQSPTMLNFVNNMSQVELAAKLSLDAISSEIQQLINDVKSLEKKLANSPPDVQTQFTDFIKDCLNEIDKLNSHMSQIQNLRADLAKHFCEEENSLRLEDCFSLFSNFFGKVRQALTENEERRKAEARKAKMKEESEKKLTLKKGNSKTTIPVEEVCIVDKLLSEIKRGSFKLRRTR